MPVTMPTCSASAFELAAYLTVRSEAFYKKSFFVCPSVATLCVVLLPLFITKTVSYGAARKACHDWSFEWKSVQYLDADNMDYNPEWEMEDYASWDLLPSHLFNSISTVVSLFSFWVWLFFSPYMSDMARDLDRTCTMPDCISQST
jgi:hypothetical protein